MKDRFKKLISLIQKKGKILKIVSNSKKGTIKVYNESGKLMMKKTNLSRDNVETIEDNLVGFITNKLNDSKQDTKDESFDPMVT